MGTSSLILHGRRSFDSQKRRHFTVLEKLLQNVFSDLSNSFSTAANLKNFTVSYLIDSLGLTTKVAESISMKVNLETNENPDSVLNLLKKHGFTDSQISDVITTYPRLLIADAEKSLDPKLNFLKSRGASSIELSEIVTKVPRILGMRYNKAISRYYDFVKDIVEADRSSKYKMSSVSLSHGSQQENTIRNVLVLRDLGVPQRSLFSLLMSNFNVVCGKERFEESVKKVVEMDFNPTTSRFVKALCVVYNLSDKTIEEKIAVYKRFGFEAGDVWTIFKKNPSILAISEKNIVESIETFIGLGFSRDEIVMMVKHCPQCIGLSAEMVKKKNEFLVKKMNWSLKVMVSNPAVFGYSLEKRVVPRCNVIKALMSKGLLGDELPSIGSVLMCTDEAFLNKFVKKWNDKKLVSELMAILTDAHGAS